MPVQAGDKLVVLEVQSDVLCQTGFEEEAELQWKADQKAALAPCSDLKHTFARTARECGDVVFLSLEVSGMCGIIAGKAAHHHRQCCRPATHLL